jgi:hypothetical protein
MRKNIRRYSMGGRMMNHFPCRMSHSLRILRRDVALSGLSPIAASVMPGVP